MRKILSFIAGLLVGLVTGGTLGILLAPEPGPDVQQRLRESVEHLLEEGRNAAEARRLELEAQLESFKQGRMVTLQENA